MIYITKQYLTDKKEKMKENQVNTFFNFRTPPEQIGCQGNTDAYFLSFFFTKIEPNKS